MYFTTRPLTLIKNYFYYRVHVASTRILRVTCVLVRLYANDFFQGFNAFNAKVAQGSNGIVLFPEPVNRFLYVAANFPFGATSTNPRRTNSANRKPKVLLLLWECRVGR